MGKKILLGVISIGLLTLAFVGGWMFKDKQQDSDYNAAIKPATQLMDGVIAASETDEAYEATTSLYQDTTKKEAFTKTANTLKNSVITNNKTYASEVDNIVTYQLTNGGKSYDAIISTTKEDGVWKVASFQVTQRIQQ